MTDGAMKIYRSEEYIRGGLSMYLFLSSQEQAEPLHTHEFVEIIYVLSGEAEQRVDGRCYSVRRGDLLFINYGASHAFLPKGDFSFVNICFKPEVIADRIISGDNAFELLSLTAINELLGGECRDMISFSGRERRLVEELLNDMIDEYENLYRERNAVLESYMTVLIAKILRKMHPTPPTDNRETTWQELLEYIGENLDKRLTLSSLARTCFYNPSYFSRAFKERFGINLVEYVSRERAEMAAHLLATTNLCLAEICSRCGYGDKSSLYRAFRRHHGTSPGEYRAALGHSDNEE